LVNDYCRPQLCGPGSQELGGVVVTRLQLAIGETVEHIDALRNGRLHPCTRE
jgi:hypothetical protein